jgi:hypothetical protein
VGNRSVCPRVPLLTRVPGGEIRGKTESARIAFHQIGIHQNIANAGGGGRPSCGGDRVAKGEVAAFLLALFELAPRRLESRL